MVKNKNTDSRWLSGFGEQDKKEEEKTDADRSYSWITLTVNWFDFIDEKNLWYNKNSQIIF